MERLGIHIANEVNTNSWLPISIAQNGPQISHLFFADDVLLFTKAKSSQVRKVFEVVNNFCRSSGFKINLQKSKVFCSKNINCRNRENFVSISQISFTSSIDKYLGFPIFHGRVKRRDFNFIIEKVQRRLAG